MSAQMRGICCYAMDGHQLLGGRRDIASYFRERCGGSVRISQDNGKRYERVAGREKAEIDCDWHNYASDFRSNIL